MHIFLSLSLSGWRWRERQRWRQRERDKDRTETETEGEGEREREQGRKRYITGEFIYIYIYIYLYPYASFDNPTLISPCVLNMATEARYKLRADASIQSDSHSSAYTSSVGLWHLAQGRLRTGPGMAGIEPRTPWLGVKTP